MHPRVKIVAAARNEAYFLPHWIFHHLYFGFSEIDIYLNKIEDNSKEILEVICKKYPQVKIYNADWIYHIYHYKGNVGDNFQTTVYAYDYFNNSDNTDFILFIDIDEYWVPKNLHLRIPSLVEDLNFPDMIVFDSIYINGTPSPYPSLSQPVKLTGYSPNLCKSLIKVGINPDFLGVHIHYLSERYRKIFANGKALKILPNSPFNQFIDSSITNGLKDAFIIHDWMRSPLFYLSSLIKGSIVVNTDKSNKGLKSNRGYYNPQFANSIVIPLDLNSPYYSKYKEFLIKCDLETPLAEAFEYQRNAAKNALKILSDNPELDLSRSVKDQFGDLKELQEKIDKQIL